MSRWPVFLALAAISVPASAYYHFIHYLNGVNVPEKYDLTALPNSTVTFFVSEAGPTVYNQTDTFNSVLSQIQQATQVWNGVSASAIRVAFGGLENTSTPQNTPGADVIFEDLPPGIYGYGGPTSTLAPVTPANGSPFIPVVRSTVILNQNLTILPAPSTGSAGPSYTATFFMTVMHEIGHSLGLQHTWTSATMSQATTQATTLSHPLDTDDIAGLATLYPASSFSQFGSISGKITSGGKGVHLASVVAVPTRPGWGAVSALTNPDGTYEIDGVPPGQYFVYAHPIPPDANIYGPWSDVAGTVVVPPSGPTTALFYPGTTSLTSATPVSVNAGVVDAGLSLDLPGRAAVELYDIQVFTYFNYNNTVIAFYPAYLDMLQNSYTSVSSWGSGPESTFGGTGPAVQILGGNAYIYGVIPVQTGDVSSLTLDIAYDLGASPGPQQLIFTTPDFMYVAPSGIFLTLTPPPTVTAATPNGDGTVTVTGANWCSQPKSECVPDSLIYFDGLPTTISSLDPVNGVAVVTPPPGPAGQTSVVTVYKSDGQNSQFLQLSAPVTYSYSGSGTAVVSSISPASLPAGAEAMVDITGTNFTFVPGAMTVGFGTSDIVVRRIFVLSATHLQVDVSVSPNAALTNPDVSVISGFQLAIQKAGFQITAPITGLPAAVPILTNAIAGLTGAYPGAIVSLYGSSLATANGATSITIGGQAATILYASPTQVNLQIPSGIQSGPAILALNNGALSAYPVVVNVDPVPASIAAIQNGSGGYITAAAPAHQGDYVIVTLTNVAPFASAIATGQVQIGIGTGASQVLYNAIPISSPGAGFYQAGFSLSASQQVGSALPLVVYFNGSSSYPATIPVATASGSFIQTGN